VYDVFKVNKETFEDLKTRLNNEGMLWKRISKDTDNTEILIFGSTAFKVERNEK